VLGVFGGGVWFKKQVTTIQIKPLAI